MGRIIRASDALNRTPTSIVNNFSTTGYNPATDYITAVTPATFRNLAIQSSLSGAMTAGTLKTVLSVTGAGVINFMAATCVDATARTLRMKLTLDGVAVFDSTSASIAVANLGGFVIGGVSLNSSAVANMQATFDQIPFASSCLFEIATSVASETDKFNVYLKYRTN